MAQTFAGKWQLSVNGVNIGQQWQLPSLGLAKTAVTLIAYQDDTDQSIWWQLDGTLQFICIGMFFNVLEPLLEASDNAVVMTMAASGTECTFTTSSPFTGFLGISNENSLVAIDASQAGDQSPAFTVKIIVPAWADIVKAGNAKGLDLSYVDFTGVKVPDAFDFTGANLSNANFSDATLTHAILGGVSLTNAVLEGTDLSGAQAAGADFSGCDLSSVKASSSPVVFQSSSHPVTRFLGATAPVSLLGIDWSYFDLTGAILTRTATDKLTGLTAVSATMPMIAVLEGMDLTGANLTLSNLRGAALNSATLERANLSGAFLEAGDGVDTPASLVSAYMPNANLAGVHANGVHFDNAHLYGLGTESQSAQASVDGADLQAAIFAGANCSSMNFSGAHLEGAQFADANLVNALFTGADFSKGPPPDSLAVSFAGAHLEGADFTEATFDSVNFTNAVIATAAGKLKSKWLGDGNKLETVFVDYGPTVLTAAQTAGCSCPDGKSQGPCSGSMLVAPAPPQPPACVSNGKNWCPAPGSNSSR